MNRDYSPTSELDADDWDAEQVFTRRQHLQPVNTKNVRQYTCNLQLPNLTCTFLSDSAAELQKSIQLVGHDLEFRTINEGTTGEGNAPTDIQKAIVGQTSFIFRRGDPNTPVGWVAVNLIPETMSVGYLYKQHLQKAA